MSISIFILILYHVCILFLRSYAYTFVDLEKRAVLTLAERRCAKVNTTITFYVVAITVHSLFHVCFVTFPGHIQNNFRCIPAKSSGALIVCNSAVSALQQCTGRRGR